MTEHRTRIPVASWPRTLKWSSCLGSILIIGVSIAAYRAIPVPSGFTHYFGLGVALIPLALMTWAVCTMVSGYELSPNHLIVRQLFGSKRIPLESVTEVIPVPDVCKGAIRIIGNGGLFGFTGLYRNTELGQFRLYATDLQKSVALRTNNSTVVISPDDVEKFVSEIVKTQPHIVDVRTYAKS